MIARREKKHITLQKVAQHAGVSLSTASLVVRGSQSISAPTREKVLLAIKELGYVYDRMAANLRSRSSSTVGLIIMELANPFYSELLVGIHQELDRFGYTVILGTTFDSLAIQERLLSTMLEHRVGGIILSAVPGSPAEPIDRIRQLGVPVVLVGRKPPNGTFDYVGIDNVKGGELAVSHLITKGHRRIAMLGGFSQLSSWQGRKQGYDNALRDASIPVDENLVLESSATRQGGFDTVQKALRLKDPPTAAFCYNDTIAIGATLKMRELGLVPGYDMALVGFDDIPEASIFSPKLTTVSSAILQMGENAARLLNSRIENPKMSPQNVILEPKLLIRESCAYKGSI